MIAHKIKRDKILGIPVDYLTMDETVKIVDQAIQENDHIHHSVINAGKVISMHEDQQLFDSVTSADIINADGFGVVWASEKLGKPLPERVPGVDLMQQLVKRSAQKGYKAYFLGAEEEIVSRVVEKFKSEYGDKMIAGYRNGFFQQEDEEEIASEIVTSGANILFVGISSPKKELFLYRNRSILQNVNFVMGVGGSFDVMAGKVKRAPKWLQKIGLEGLARFVQEPKKMWRRFIVDNIRFLLLVFQYKRKSSKTISK